MEGKGPLEKAPFVPKQQAVFVVSIVLDTGLSPAVAPVRYTETKADAQRFAQEVLERFKRIAASPDVKDALGFLGASGMRVVISEIQRHSPLEVMPGNSLLVGKA